MSRATYIPDLLSLLGDVAIASPVSGHALVHNGTAWANRALTTSDVSGLGGLLASKANLTGGNTFTGPQQVNAAGGTPVHKIDTDLGLISFGSLASVDANTGTFAGDGSGLTGLPAANLTGTVNDGRLSANVAMRNAANTFTSPITIGSGSNIILNGMVLNRSTSALEGNGANPVRLRGHAGFGGTIVEFSSASNQTSGSVRAMQILPVYNQASGTAGNTDLLINRTQTAVGSGPQLLIDAQVNSVSVFSVSPAGNFSFRSTSFGGGVGVLGIANATTIPSVNPLGGGVIYIESGALKYRGSSGTVTTLAAA